MTIFYARSLTTIALLPLTLASVILGSPALAAATTATSQKPPCRIDIADAHSSTYFLEVKKINAVKVNVVSICNQAQQELTIYVEIHKTGWLTDHLVQTFRSMEFALVPAGKEVKMENAFVFCKNNRKTTYYGIAYGKALVEGKWVFAPRGRSKNNMPLYCGT